MGSEQAFVVSKSFGSAKTIACQGGGRLFLLRQAWKIRTLTLWQIAHARTLAIAVRLGALFREVTVRIITKIIGSRQSRNFIFGSLLGKLELEDFVRTEVISILVSSCLDIITIFISNKISTFFDIFSQYSPS